MRILMTGTNGFIAGNVCVWIRKKGWQVIGMGRQAQSRIPCDDYISIDLGKEKATEILNRIPEGYVDAVVHLAADMRHEPYTVSVVGTNCTGTQRLLEFCEAKKIPVFVQLSSLPVIGSPVQHPVTEEHPLRPYTVYHCTKRMQELLANYADYTFGLRTVSYRITAPVGIGVNPKTIFPTFVRKAIHNEDIVLYGQGMRQQNYVHVDDIAQAIYKAILSETAHGVYNLASHNLISNYDLAKKCIAVTGSESKIVFSGNPDPLDGVIWDVSLDKIKRDTGYEPVVSIEYAIRELAESFSKEEKQKEGYAQ